MKSYIIKKYYQSKRDAKINQTVYLKKMHGGEYLRGEWTENKSDAYVFIAKQYAIEIKKALKLEGLTIIEIKKQ